MRLPSGQGWERLALICRADGYLTQCRGGVAKVLARSLRERSTPAHQEQEVPEPHASNKRA
eukprot:9530831-Alexandrium_andersonii.AAC.1